MTQITATLEPWLSVREAAQYASRHEKTVLRALRRGELEGFQAGGVNHSWRVRPSAVDAWCGKPTA